MAQIARVRTVFTGVAGTPWYSNMYFTHIDGETGDLVIEVDSFWTTLAFAINGAVDAVVEGDVAIIDDTTGDIVDTVSVTPGAVNMSGTGDVLPPATQVCVHLLTGTFNAGRRLRGRLFIPGLIEAFNSPTGAPNPTDLATVAAAANTLRTATSSPGPWRVYSPTYHTSAVIDSVSTMTKFAVLRSRRD